MQMQTKTNLNYKLESHTQASKQLDRALNNLPRLAQLASYHTGHKVPQSQLTVRIVNSQDFKRINDQIVHDNNSVHLGKLQTKQLSTKTTSISRDMDRMTQTAPSLYSRASQNTPNQIVINADKVKGLRTKQIEELFVHELIHFSQADNYKNFFDAIGQLQAATAKAEYVYGKNDKRTVALDNAYKDNLYSLENDAQKALNSFKRSPRLGSIERAKIAQKARISLFEANAIDGNLNKIIQKVVKKDVEKSPMRAFNSLRVKLSKIGDELFYSRQRLQVSMETAPTVHQIYDIHPGHRPLRESDLSYGLLNSLAYDVINRRYARD